MLLEKEKYQRNSRYHLIEGALYISTNALIALQTLMPALIKRLGGNDVLVGAWPVVVYLAFFLPQIFSANYSGQLQYRKPTVIRLGFLQRIHILILACCIGMWGASMPFLTLILLFVLYILNQVISGLVSPIWMDFFIKTTTPENRGKLIGLRTSTSAVLGLVNSFILTLFLTVFPYPLNYAVIIGFAFLYQMSSLFVQHRIKEDNPSIISIPIRMNYLFRHVRSLIHKNSVFRKFLFSSMLLTISFTSIAFYTVSAIQRCTINEMTIGIFTILTLVGQIISGTFVGWLADLKGTKSALLICAGSLILSIGLSILATSEIWYYLIFLLVGITTGSEVAMRYYFAIECAPEDERPMYVGIMNGSLAPCYLITPFAGFFSSIFGYNSIFIFSLIVGLVGFIFLVAVPEPRFKKLALSSK